MYMKVIGVIIMVCFSWLFQLYGQGIEVPEFKGEMEGVGDIISPMNISGGDVKEEGRKESIIQERTEGASQESADTEVEREMSVEEYYQLGRELMAEGKYREANEVFKKAQELLSKEDIAETELFKSRSSEEEVVESVSQKETEKVVEEKDVLEEAQEAYSNHDYDLAIKLYSEAADRYPENGDIYYNLGICYLRKNNYSGAADMFEKVISINPRDADAYYNLGALYETYLNNKKLAIKYYKKYLKFCRDKVEKKRIKEWIKHLKEQEVK